MRRRTRVLIVVVAVAASLLTGCAESSNATACKLYADEYNQMADLAKAKNDASVSDVVGATAALAPKFGDAFNKASGDVAVKIRNSRDAAQGMVDDPQNEDSGVAFFGSAESVAKACSEAGAAITLDKTNMDRLERQYDDALAGVAAGTTQVKGGPLTPYMFGAVPPVPGSDNTAALLAMFKAAAGTAYPSGASIYIPPGLWRYSSAAGLPLTTNMVVKGAGRRSRLVTVGSSNLFEWNTVVSGVNFENLYLESASPGKAIFAPGASGGIFASTFRQLFLIGSKDTSRIWDQHNGQSFIHNTFEDSEMQRTAASSVVPFSIINTGGGANFNEFNQVRISGNNNTTTPFFHFESTLPRTYMTDWTFINILGEQNRGGIMTVRAAFNWKLLNVTDEDSTAAYTANLIDFRANRSGLGSRSINIENSGRRGQSMSAGKYDISVDPATSTEVTIINCNPTPTSSASLLNIPANSVVLNTRNYSSPFQGTGAPTLAPPVG